MTTWLSRVRINSHVRGVILTWLILLSLQLDHGTPHPALSSFVQRERLSFGFLEAWIHWVQNNLPVASLSWHYGLQLSLRSHQRVKRAAFPTPMLSPLFQCERTSIRRWPFGKLFQVLWSGEMRGEKQTDLRPFSLWSWINTSSHIICIDQF